VMVTVMLTNIPTTDSRETLLMKASSNRVYSCTLLCTALLASNVTGVASGNGHRVHVTILRCESSIHTSVSNRDAYIVRVQPKSGKQFVARIVDQYPGYSDAPLISRTKDDVLLSVALRRTPYCDSEMRVTDGPESMKCFEVVHESWRLPKSANEDQWWK
jgi:hypothetical protein